MSKSIGRLGYLGLGMESTPGTPNTTPDVFIPYTDISLRGHHEPIEVIGSTASRLMDRTSVIGKKWAEGDLAIDLDTKVIGYFLKMAFGNEILTTGTPNEHNFFVTTSGNTPKTATMIFGRDTDVEQYSYMSLNELTLEVSDGLATASASFLGNFPSDGATQTPTVTSGTVMAFPDYDVRFGADLTAAAAAGTTPVNDFTLTISNNVETIFQSGQATPTAIRTKGLQVTGGYTLFFDSETDKDAYYGLNKRAMEITFTGINSEELKVRIPRMRLNEGEVSTGIDDFFEISTEITVEDQVGAGGTIDSGVRLIDAVLKNDKADVY